MASSSSLENPPIIKIARQLHAFLSLPSRVSGINARSSTFQSLSKIVRDYPPLEAPEQQSSKKQTRSTPLEEPPYPPEWKVDSSLVCRAIHRFKCEYTPAVEEPLAYIDDLHAESVNAPEAPRKPHQPLIQPSEQPVSQPLPIMAGLSDKQLRVISTAVAAAVTNAQQADRATHPTLTSHGFRARDLGMFNPDPSLEAVKSKEGYQIFHDVWSFTERVKSKSTTPELVKVIRENLDACLLGKAKRWYTSETDAVGKNGLRNDPDSCTLWCKALESRFRKAPGISLSRLESLRYTFCDA